MTTHSTQKPLDTVHLGVVGVRNIGKNHIRLALETEGAKVVAIADTDPARLAEAAAEFSVPHMFTDANDLFASDQVDAVILALPNHLHAPLSIAALQAGKHVLVEKPIARTLEDADAMIAARDVSGKTLMVGMNQRLSAYNSAVKKAIASGAIGRPCSASTGWLTTRMKLGFWNRGAWAMSMEASGGGPMLDLGIHKLDLTLHFLDFPKAIRVIGNCFTGIGKREAAEFGIDYQIEDGAIGLIQFADGTVLTVEASYFQNTPTPGQWVRIHGDKGSAYTPGEQPLCQYAADGTITPLPFQPDASAPGSCATHFVRVLRGKESLIPTAEQAREGLRLIRAIYTSAQTGKPVELT